MLDTITEVPVITKNDSKTDLVIYGNGKIGKALVKYANRAKAKDLYFASDIYTVDINGSAQFETPEEIKDLPSALIHIIAIDTGIELSTENKGIVINEEPTYKPNTHRINELIKDIINERGTTNPDNDLIIIESTVEIGWYDSIKELRETYPNWDIFISPERYNEDTLNTDGFYMDDYKLFGIEVIDSLQTDEEAFTDVTVRAEAYLKIFNANSISIIMGRIKEVEASKVVENSFRYLNLSFVNELQGSLAPEGIDLESLLGMVGTKQGLEHVSKFKPGLIGGGCIPIDPLYLPKLEESVISHVIKTESTRIPSIIKLITTLITKSGLKNIGFMGVSYKANTSSVSNSSYLNIIKKLGDLFKGEDSPKIYVFDHIVGDTPDDYFVPEKLGTMDLLIVGANHNFADTTYLEIAIASGANVLNVNNLSLYRASKDTK